MTSRRGETEAYLPRPRIASRIIRFEIRGFLATLAQQSSRKTGGWQCGIQFFRWASCVQWVCACLEGASHINGHQAPLPRCHSRKPRVIVNLSQWARNKVDLRSARPDL